MKSACPLAYFIPPRPISGNLSGNINALMLLETPCRELFDPLLKRKQKLNPLDNTICKWAD